MKKIEEMNKEELLEYAKRANNGYKIIDIAIILSLIFSIVGYFIEFDNIIYSIVLDILFIVDCIVIIYIKSFKK